MSKFDDFDLDLTAVKVGVGAVGNPEKVGGTPTTASIACTTCCGGGVTNVGGCSATCCLIC